MYKEIQTFNLKRGVIHDEFDNELVYNTEGLIVQSDSGDFMKTYSNFTDLGKPGLIVNQYSIGVDKKFYEYDAKGNIIKFVYSIKYTDPNNKVYICKKKQHVTDMISIIM